MNQYFLQELNAITNYANNSDTIGTERFVREMLKSLLAMSNNQLSGNRVCECNDKCAGADDYVER